MVVSFPFSFEPLFSINERDVDEEDADSPLSLSRETAPSLAFDDSEGLGIALPTLLASSSTNTASGRTSLTIRPASCALSDEICAVPSK